MIWDYFDKQLRVNINFRIHRLELMRYRQHPEETIDEFVTRCRDKSRQCDFSKEELNERIVELVIASTHYDGMQRELLQKPAGYALTDVVSLGRQYEAIAAGKQCLSNLSPVSNIDAIRRNPQGPNKGGRPRTSDCKQCGFCGLHHPPRQCPAYRDTCKHCGRRGHWAKCCRSKSDRTPVPSWRRRSRQERVDAMPVEEGQLLADHGEEGFSQMFSSILISSMDTTAGESTEAFTVLSIACPSKVGKHRLQVKVDTGAGGNTLPLRIIHEMYPKGQWRSIVRPRQVQLTAYNGSNIPCIGSIDLMCLYKDSTWTRQEFFVVEVAGPAILGLPGSKALSVVTIHTVTKDDKPLEYIHDQVQSIQTVKDLVERWPQQFDRIGDFKEPANLLLKNDATPHIDAPRKCSIHIKDKLKAELDKMEDQGVIRKVTHHTDWCSSITTAIKKDGSIRVCLDPKRLNKNLKRCPHKIQTLEEVNPEFVNGKYFTKLDAKSGYWSVHLSEDSQELTTFRSPFGRYCFLRLPFGLSTSQDVFQQRMDNIIGQVPGCVCIADDVVVMGSTEAEHDRNLWKLFETAAKEGLVFNSSKCVVKAKSINFFGTIYSEVGISPDPCKVEDIHAIPTPQDKEDLQRFLGMMNFLSPYIPKYADQVAILRDLLKKGVPYLWQEDHQEAYCQLRKAGQQDSSLKYYDPETPVTLEVDASSKGLGACLLQQGKPVAYASKSLSPCQAQYSNIERETLGLVFGITRFHTYLFGRDFKVLTDHKPLVTICAKPLTSAPPRLQRLLVKIQGYNFTIEHRPGTEMIISDTLSRLPNPLRTEDVPLDVHVEGVLLDEVEDTLGIDLLHFGILKQQALQKETTQDPVLQKVKEFTHTGWPATIQELPNELRPYWPFRDELGMSNGVIFKGRQVIVPQSMRTDILQQLHSGHQGIEKMRLLARQSVYWPNINRNIDELVRKCKQCQEHIPQQRREPLLPHEIPITPWTKIGIDLFELDRVQYLIMVYYHSKFPVVHRLASTTSAGVANAITGIFSLLGSPTEVMSDNGPQFVGAAFQQMCKEWGITHTTSSPRYPQSNGLVERMVQTVKGIIRKTQATGESSAAALLNLRSTPIDAHLPSPAKCCLVGRSERDSQLT
ncbi:PREDICTED: uncharacterized protein K02A2.6-like [Priapulus caudatus]|uniref:RNA-directed DNA polymerase n=1 Tax=Priapulus caudatus TaxID=37621 RepID=A0ABM1DTU8_PRICU|nr:PREDICTED: uncharacterized protein K02A2.6-like [Priapulus caudatus]